LSGLGTWQSGSALTITTSSGQSPTGATTNRADLVGDWKQALEVVRKFEPHKMFFFRFDSQTPGRMIPFMRRDWGILLVFLLLLLLSKAVEIYQVRHPDLNNQHLYQTKATEIRASLR
jgi:hypothetical protein